jgi:hypothetical protein
VGVVIAAAGLVLAAILTQAGVAGIAVAGISVPKLVAVMVTETVFALEWVIAGLMAAIANTNFTLLVKYI